MFAAPARPIADSLLLTPAEVAPLLRVSERTLWTLTKKREIPHVRLGGRVFYTRESISDRLRELSAASVQQQA
jgi:excisionase family DNA binding protein